MLSIKKVILYLFLVGMINSLNAQSKVNFEIKNAGATVEGSFSEFDANVSLDKKSLKTSRFDGVVKIKSINTGIAMRDRHLLKKDYFYSEKYPEMIFKTREMKLMTDGSFRAVGDITIRGVSKELTFKIVEESGVYKATAKLNRRDFEVGGWNLTMSDEVDLIITIAK